MDSNFEWTWSEPHEDYYYVTYDNNGNPVYHWAKQLQAAPSSSAQQAYVYQQQQYDPSHTGIRNRSDSVAPSMPEPVPQNRRPRNLIPGTPSRGWYEPLDTSYCMRTGYEARQFFKKGRVFAMLWAEAASETLARAGTDNTAITVGQFQTPPPPHDPAITIGRFQQSVYSQIRRFVVVEVRRGFVYACAISTYSGRGTTKSGCNAAEHSVVYLSGNDPIYLNGEYEKGMIKEPIEVEPANNSITMDRSSRLRFGKTFPVEMNVKVKDIGRVVPHHMSKLIQYWQEEDRVADDNDEMEGGETPQAIQTPRPSHGSPAQTYSGYGHTAQAVSAYGATTHQGYSNQAPVVYRSLPGTGYAPPGNSGYPPQQHHY